MNCPPIGNSVAATDLPPTITRSTSSGSVMRAAEPLDPFSRSAFLNSVANRLRGEVELGDGVVSRICRELQRDFIRRRGRADISNFCPPPLRAANADRANALGAAKKRAPAGVPFVMSAFWG
jgi:hypothetical protein